MDGHHHQQQLPPHSGLEQTYQNGYGTNDEYSNILSNAPDHHQNYSNWGFDAHNNVASHPHQDPYLSWQSTNTGLNNYGAHAYVKSPSNIHPDSYAGYGSQHPFTASSSYDPSLVAGSGMGGASSFALGNPYGQQQPVQHGTIAPQALEQERLHGSRSVQNHQVRAS